MVGISPIFVCLGQFRCVYDPVLSVVDNIFGISPGFVCYGQLWLV